MPKKMRKKSKKMTRQEGEGLADLARAASRYFDHPDVEKILGFQVSTRALIDLQEIEMYMQDHVISEEGEGITRHDGQLIAETLRNKAALLTLPAVAAIPFALRSAAIAARLREAADHISR